ncbi:unnamed protein product [Brassica napus]|uniref:(rape) hypothetical protein n=1 Tax=Brassica napus TaxID=3708 RepID=A0A816W530_BRANA|nr:unnamed protein product [Brassica napus]
MDICLACSQQDHPIYEDEPTDKSKLWGDLEEEEEEELEDGMESVDTLSSTPTGTETPNAIEEKGIR